MEYHEGDERLKDLADLEKSGSRDGSIIEIAKDLKDDHMTQ